VSLPVRARTKHPGKPIAQDLFLPRKEKAGIFLAAKIFAGPGDPDIFLKIRNPKKSHAGEKICQSSTYPVSG